MAGPALVRGPRWQRVSSQSVTALGIPHQLPVGVQLEENALGFLAMPVGRADRLGIAVLWPSAKLITEGSTSEKVNLSSRRLPLSMM